MGPYRNFRKNCEKLGISAPQYAVAGLFSGFLGEDSGSFVELRLLFGGVERSC